jgi:hypothetical protein
LVIVVHDGLVALADEASGIAASPRRAAQMSAARSVIREKTWIIGEVRPGCGSIGRLSNKCRPTVVTQRHFSGSDIRLSTIARDP